MSIRQVEAYEGYEEEERLVRKPRAAKKTKAIQKVRDQKTEKPQMKISNAPANIVFDISEDKGNAIREAISTTVVENSVFWTGTSKEELDAIASKVLKDELSIVQEDPSNYLNGFLTQGFSLKETVQIMQFSIMTAREQVAKSIAENSDRNQALFTTIAFVTLLMKDLQAGKTVDIIEYNNSIANRCNDELSKNEGDFVPTYDAIMLYNGGEQKAFDGIEKLLDAIAETLTRANNLDAPQKHAEHGAQCVSQPQAATSSILNEKEIEMTNQVTPTEVQAEAAVAGANVEINTTGTIEVNQAPASENGVPDSGEVWGNGTQVAGLSKLDNAPPALKDVADRAYQITEQAKESTFGQTALKVTGVVSTVFALSVVSGVGTFVGITLAQAIAARLKSDGSQA